MKRIIVLLCTLWLFSCQKETEDKDDWLLPLKVGNNWTYLYKTYQEDGTTASTQTIKLMVTGTTSPNFQEHFVIIAEPFPSDTLMLLRSDDNTVYEYNKNMNKDLVYYKWPAAEGEILSSTTVFNSRYEIVASSGTFTYNSFESHKVTANSYLDDTLWGYSEIYFKPQLGITGMISYSKKTSGTEFYKVSEQTLVSYDLK